MSVKILASYQRPEELPPLIEALKPFTERVRHAQQKGQFKRVYIYLRKGYETGITFERVSDA